MSDLLPNIVVTMPLKGDHDEEDDCDVGCNSNGDWRLRLVQTLLQDQKREEETEVL
jgi:hypothetical protein